MLLHPDGTRIHKRSGVGSEWSARIRGAFVGEFDDYMAKYYYIDGKRGEVKKIALPRDLVIWE